jgi:hypothetical protein
MKASKGQTLGMASTTVLGDAPSAPLEHVAEPKNRRQRRARAAQVRAIKKAIARGEDPRVFITVG